MQKDDATTMSAAVQEFRRPWTTREKMENMEQEFRRGYKSGWAMAVERLGDMIFDQDMTPKEAFRRLQRHGGYDLWRWAFRGDYSVMTEPPICPLVPVGEADGDNDPHPQWGDED